jgi:cysteine desulfurase
MSRQPIYLDCAASTPMEPEVIEFITYHFKNTWGNPHSRTHEYGSNARKIVETARAQVAAIVDAKPQEVVFTSGATEANNMVIQSMAKTAEAGEKVHVLASCIEHPSVLEPLKFIEKKGVEVELVDVLKSGQIDLDDFQRKLRPTTNLVSVMQVNSETGIKQPIFELCDILSDHTASFHVDAAQGFGKNLQPLRNRRIDLISCSSHKIFGPKGVGALIIRDHPRTRNLITPLIFGGGQENGLRPGTAPAPIIGGFGKACELALMNNEARQKICKLLGDLLFNAVASIPHELNGENEHRIYSTANIAFNGLDSESFMILTKNIVSASNGTACASDKITSSRVLKLMGKEELASKSIRFSWSHLNDSTLNWDFIQETLTKFA